MLTKKWRRSTKSELKTTNSLLIQKRFSMVLGCSAKTNSRMLKEGSKVLRKGMTRRN